MTIMLMVACCSFDVALNFFMFISVVFMMLSSTFVFFAFLNQGSFKASDA